MLRQKLDLALFVLALTCLPSRAVSADAEKRVLGIRALAFSPDGKILAASTGEPNEPGQVILWDLAARKPLWTHQEKTGAPSVAFSPDGKTLAVGVYDNTAKLLESATGQVRFTLQGHTKAVRGVAFSPDGKTLATASWDRTLKLWNPATGGEIKTFEGHSERIYMVTFSSDGKLLASAGLDREARLWDVDTGKTVQTFQHGGLVVRAALFADNDWLVTTGYDGTARLWNIKTGKLQLRFHGLGGLDSAAYAPASGLLAVCGSFEKGVQLFDLPLKGTSEKERERIRSLVAKLDDDNYQVREGAGKELLTFGLKAEPELERAMKETKSFEVRIRARRLRAEMQSKPTALLKGHSDSVEFVTFSPDGKMLASGGKDGVVKLWDVTKRQEIAALTQLAPSTKP